MGRIVNRSWQTKMIKRIDARETIDETTSFTQALQWLITVLTVRSVPFKIYNMGAGVRRITTVTDICPCCRALLKNK